MATMKAVRIHSYGGPEALAYEDAPRPAAGEGELLVRVHAAGVNPLDWKVRVGLVRDWLPHRLPLIPGWDLSGTVEAAGPGVSGFAEGDEVFALMDFMRDGAYAEYAVVRAAHAAHKPASLDHAAAAAVPLAALTAWQALFDIGRLSHGQTVLIHGAAGGVGHFAVQLAAWRGARVIGTASAANEEFLRGLGAAEVIDYRERRFEDETGEVDLVLDTIGGETQERSWGGLKKGGMLVGTLGIDSPRAAERHGAQGKGVLVRPDASELAQIAFLIDAEEVAPSVARVFPLPEAAQAHEMSAGGHVRGKLVLRVRPESGALRP